MTIKVASSKRCILGEGPHWDEKSGTLLYVDSLSGEIHRYDPNLQKETQSIRVGGKIGNVVPYSRSPNEAVACVNREIQRVDLISGTAKRLAEVPDADIALRINDGKCDLKGRLWTGTMPNISTLETFQDGKAALYTFSKGSLQEKVGNIGLSNGMAWTQNSKTMFYVDSYKARSIYAFDYDLDTGNIANRRIVVNYETNAEYKDFSLPDGMTIDVEDKIWIACFGPGLVLHIDPETGKILEKLQFPTSHTTSCCFGGPTYQELYVTSAKHHLTPEQMASQPEAGALFKVTGLQARGLPPASFAG